jgi:hypothetical protein
MWFPKMTGKMYNETVSKCAFAALFIGFNLTFIPQFVLGMDGMPRRYYDYPPQYQTLHTISTIGAYLNGFGIEAFVILLRAGDCAACLTFLNGTRRIHNRGHRVQADAQFAFLILIIACGHGVSPA